MDSRYTQAGFSLLELIVAMALATMAMIVLVSVFATSSRLADRSTTVSSSHEEHRRNLDAVAGALRDAVASTLGGFDSGGTATEPSFQRVATIDEEGLVLEDPSKISWRPTPEKVVGIAQPGELVLTQGTSRSVIARRVPADGFQVTRLGKTLRISITTYSSGPNHMVETVSIPTSLTLRN